MATFMLHSPWEPKGDQPKAIQSLIENFQKQIPKQTLLGVTGSGKTFVMAHLIQKLGLPTLVISHNKTLAAQLYAEFRSFFPNNAVEYFISYYDFYQPEAYLPQRDVYIEKEASINEQLDRLRMAATSALLSRSDVIIVASVSCIYSLGDPKDYKEMVVRILQGQMYPRDRLLRDLVDIQYTRNDFELTRGRFRVRGDVIELWPSYIQLLLRIELFGDTVESVSWCDPITGQMLQKVDSAMIYPAKHYVMPQEKVVAGYETIEQELQERLKELKKQGKMIEADRLNTRVHYDLEMLQEVGYCSGIENYARHFSRRKVEERPHCLLDYFPHPFLTIVDESHVTIPLLKGMYVGDHSRKQTLIEHGFRLPSCLDNRPNRLDEWEQITNNVLFVSATPATYELEASHNTVIELLVRPTGLTDPLVEVRSATNQVQDILACIQERAAKNERVLITTLTKRLAEDLTEYLQSKNIKVAYLHCDVETFERVNILQDLRRGKYDAVVGINLLREGLDLPEVSLVAILDADKEGFLRSETSLIQTMGRAARHINAMVILYADRITSSMEKAIAETQRRREIQIKYNQEHNITPQTIQKEIMTSIEYILDEEKKLETLEHSVQDPSEIYQAAADDQIEAMELQMREAAARLEFEVAAALRDRIAKLKGLPTQAKYAPKIRKQKKKRRF